MKYLLQLTFILCFFSNLFAQEGSIDGTIVDEFGNKLENVNITIKGDLLGTTTDGDGRYILKDIPTGSRVVIASFLGFATTEKSVTVQESKTSTLNFTLKSTSQGLDEVVVTGQRETGYVATEQSAVTFGSRDIVDIPQSVSVITQEVLIDQQVRSLGDLVRNDPSVIVSNPPGFNETVNIRGYNLDNSSSYRRENLIFQNQVQSPFENKAAVEIIKGPAALRYGFAPPGGLVNYVLKRPTEKTYSWVQTFGDSNGSIGVHGDFGGKVGDKFGYRINALVAEEATFVNDVSGPRQFFSAFFEWEPLENLRIDIEGEYQYRNLEQQATIRLNSFDESLSIEERQQLIEDFDPTTFIGQEWGTYPTRNFVGSIGAEYTVNDNWSIFGRVQKMQLIRDQQAAGIVDGSLQANGDFETEIFFDPSQVRDPLSLDIFANGSFNTFGLEHDLSFGVAHSRNPLRFSLDEGGNFLAGTSNIFAPVALERPVALSGQTLDALIFTQKAAYVTDFIKVLDNLEVLAGVRWTEQENEDVFNDEGTLQTSYKDDIFTPNFGVIYSPVEAVNLYTSYSTGVTAGQQIPNIADNFGENVFLDPVETEQFEIGFKSKLFKRALLTGAYFDIDQPLAFIDDNNIFRYGGSQRHRGVELSLAGQLTDRARIIFGGLYLDAEIDNPSEPDLDGNRPQSVPELQLNTFVDYKLPVKGLDVNAGLFYTGDRFADNSEGFEVDGYFRLDLGARYGFTLGHTQMTARLNVRNITNNQFLEGLAFGQFLYGAPVTGILSLAAEF
ncbi:TonB-dependent siderophore receptor [Croceiramulus getboli]|nr:TonB-dependent receptor [Flavobacteriaceae bacterium YJPT1-3]